MLVVEILCRLGEVDWGVTHSQAAIRLQRQLAAPHPSYCQQLPLQSYKHTLRGTCRLTLKEFDLHDKGWVLIAGTSLDLVIEMSGFLKLWSKHIPYRTCHSQSVSHCCLCLTLQVSAKEQNNNWWCIWTHANLFPSICFFAHTKTLCWGGHVGASIMWQSAMKTGWWNSVSLLICVSPYINPNPNTNNLSLLHLNTRTNIT